MLRSHSSRLALLLSALTLCLTASQAAAQSDGPSPGLAPAAPAVPDTDTAQPPPQNDAPAAAPVAPPPPSPAPPVSARPAATVTASATLPVVEVPKRPRKKKRPPFPAQLGLRGSASGLLADQASIFGFAGQLRYRPARRFALDLGAGWYRGRVTNPDISFDKRREVPVSAEFTFFMKATGMLQIYLVTGPFVTFANNTDTRHDKGASRQDVYVGHSFGLGLELRLGKHLGLHGELRGFGRARVQDGSDEVPEFQERNSRGHLTGNTTEVTSGGLLTLGATLYFGT